MNHFLCLCFLLFLDLGGLELELLERAERPERAERVDPAEDLELDLDLLDRRERLPLDFFFRSGSGDGDR